MVTYRAEIDAIMKAYNSGTITIDEANKQLDALDGVQDGVYGVGFYLASDRAKGCNAWIYSGIGDPDPVVVKDGKVVGGCHPSYYVYYDGKTWHTKDIGDDTLVEGPPDLKAWSKETEPLADELDMGRKIENAGKVVRQRTKRGTYDVYYNDLGYATKAVKV